MLSGWRDENITGCPALTNSSPSAPPIRPAPIEPILTCEAWVDWAKTSSGLTPRATAPRPTPVSWRKVRRLRSASWWSVMLFISSDRRRLASAPRDQGAPECATRHGRLPVMKRIGVLGGMSPQATMDLESRVHHVSQRIVPQDWNAGYPPMVVWFHRRRPIRLGPDGSPMVPLQVDPELVEAARWLGKGVDFLVIPCNAAHVGVAQIEEAAGCPVLSMVGVAIEETVRRGWRRVGVLGFRSAPAVYTGPLGDRGIACVEIDGTRQARLDAAIRAVMEGRNGEDETD